MSITQHEIKLSSHMTNDSYAAKPLMHTDVDLTIYVDKNIVN